MKGQDVRIDNNNEVFGELLKYIVPGIVGLLFNSLYIVIDGLFVARMLGRDALAAVTLAVPVMEIMIAFSMLISIGSGVIISNLNGQGKVKEGRKVFNISSRVLLLLSITIAIVPNLLLRPIIKLLGGTEDIYFLTRDYLRALLLLAPGFMFSYGLGTWSRNDGQPKVAMVAQVVGALVNIGLDWLFMGPLQMGIRGAAIATGLGPIVGIAIMLPHFIRKKGDLYFEKVKMDLGIISDVMKKGVPSFSMEFALGLTTLCMNIVISKYLGVLGLAVYGIVGYIALILYSVFLGMAEGSQPLLSYYHGAEDDGRKKSILSISIIISVITGILGYIVLNMKGVHVIKIFAGKDVKLIQGTVAAVKIYFVGLFITGINIVSSSFMQSVGDWKESVFISLLRSVLILYPVLLILPKFFGVESIWLGVAVTEAITLLFTIYILIKKYNFIGYNFATEKENVRG